MTTVLISGASGVVGYGILRSLKKAGHDLRLLGTTTHAHSVAPAFCDVFERATATENANYFPWLLETIGRHKVDVAIPGIEMDMQSWSDHRPLLQGVVKCVLNSRDLIALCRDKWLFYLDLLQRSDPCAIPTYNSGKFDELVAACGLPFLLKPRRGFGSKGIVKVENETVFLTMEARFGPELIAQPIVGSDQTEYSISCFGDGEGGLLNMFSLRRRLGPGGFTEWAEVVDSEPFAATVSRLCSFYHPLGPTNFQFRDDFGELKLLEINPRISSATSIRAAFGYNEPRMAVDFFMQGLRPPAPETGRGVAVRYMEDYIIPA